MRKDDDALTISNVNEGDQGTYTCTVQSEIEQKSASARLTVLGTVAQQQTLASLRVIAHGSPQRGAVERRKVFK